MTLSNTTRIGPTEHMEVEAEATTMAEIPVATTTFEETTYEAMALGETAFVEVDLTKSAMYAESQDAGQRNTPLRNESKPMINSVNMLLVSTGNLQLHITRTSWLNGRVLKTSRTIMSKDKSSSCSWKWK